MLDDTGHIHQFVREFIENETDDWEKFHLLFYGSLSSDKITFNNLNGKCSVIPGVDVTNNILAQLKGKLSGQRKFLAIEILLKMTKNNLI